MDVKIETYELDQEEGKHKTSVFENNKAPFKQTNFPRAVRQPCASVKNVSSYKYFFFLARFASDEKSIDPNIIV